jgi:hypothetical protein
MTYNDEGHAITLEQVLKTGLKYSRDLPSAVRTSAVSRAPDDEVCNSACPRCCTRGRSPHPSSRNSSRTNSRAGSPRPTRAFRTVHDSKYWANLGIDDIYHTYATVLEVNGISPHQVLLEAHIDNFAHQDAGDAIAAVAAKFPESDVSDLAGSRLFISLCFFSYPRPFLVLFFWGAYTDFLFGGLSMWRAVFMSVFLFSLGLDQLLFATRWSSLFYCPPSLIYTLCRHFIGDQNPPSLIYTLCDV